MRTPKNDWKEYTILVPMMAEPHFTLIQAIMLSYGYHLEILRNHIVAKGVMANIREKYPHANVVAVDYDPGACEANQQNSCRVVFLSIQCVILGYRFSAAI